MPLRVTCSGCQTVLAAPDAAVGKAVRCPKCQAVVPVPAPAAAGPSAAAVTAVPNGPPPAPTQTKQPAPVETLPEEPEERPERTRQSEEQEDLRQFHLDKDGEEPRPGRKRERDQSAGRRRPAAAQKKGAWVLPVILGVAVLGVLACCGVGGWGVYAYFGLVSDRARRDLHGNAPDQAPFVVGPGQPAFPPGPPGDPGPLRPAEPPKPPDVLLKMPPLPAAVPIKSPGLKGETTVNLPDTVGSLAVGGGGRFLVMHFPKLRKLGIFDINEVRVSQFIPVSEADVQIAAGMSKLVVYLPGSNTVERWDLLTQQREFQGNLPGDRGKITAFCMGHASAGPLLICAERSGVRFHDLGTFEEMPYSVNGQGLGQGPGALYWAGADGRIFGATSNLGQPNGVATLVIDGGKVQTQRQRWGTWFVQPGPDARHICAAGHGLLTDRVQPADDVVYSKQNGSIDYTFVPAHQGPYYLHLHLKTGLHAAGTGINKDDPEWGATVYLLGEKRPIAQMPNLRIPTYAEWNALSGLGILGCVHMVPRANLIAVVPASRDKLVLSPFNVEEELERSGVKYLLITSEPPASVKRGQALAYAVKAKARAGGVTFKLESGPQGMTVTPQGQLNWQVPGDFADRETEVLISARDADGQQVFHSFPLTVEAP